MTKFYLRVSLILLMLMATIGTLSCVKSYSPSGPGPGPGPGPNGVSMRDNFFNPLTLTVTLPASGSVTVTWVNNGAFVHTATSDDGTSFNTGDILPGQSKSVTFTAKGTHLYHCVYHVLSGMKGTVVVQ